MVSVVSFSPYRRVLRSADLRLAMVLGFVVRVPVFASGVLLTVHVVTTLHGTYAAAGVLSAVGTVAIAVAGPWRGRLIDVHGLRRVVLPSTLVSLACWSVAPFVSYWPLLALAAVAGLFVIPSFSIVRQLVIAAVPGPDRRTAISLDAVSVELAFIVGPPVTIWAAAHWGSRSVLLVTQMVGVVGGLLLLALNPALVAEGEGEQEHVPRREWLRLPFVTVCLAAASATLVLGGTDIGIVAAVRALGEPGRIGLVLAAWGVGSLLGGLVYGALSRPISAFWLLLGLGVVTLPMALSGGSGALALTGFVAGLFCAPTITATVDQVSRVVPARARGEAMGWHGSALTGGGAIGAPVAGLAIDALGWRGGFLVTAGIGVVIALAALVTLQRRTGLPASAALGEH